MNNFEQGPGDEQMSAFERDLQRAMRRVEVRGETAAKFLALAAEAEQRRAAAGRGPRLVKLSNGGRVLALPKLRTWTWGALAAVLVLGVFGGEQVHRERRRQQTEQQFATAMRITDHALDKAQAQLERAGVRLGN